MKWHVRESPSLDPSTNDRKFYRWSWMGDVSPTRPQHSKALLMIDLTPGVFGDEHGSYILIPRIGRGDGGRTPLGTRQLAECEEYLAARKAEYEAELVRCGWRKGAGRCWTPPPTDEETPHVPLPDQPMELILVAYDEALERSVLVLAPERYTVSNGNSAEPAANAAHALIDDTSYCYPAACLFEADYTPEQWAGLKAACASYR